jgi:hypothetical protein
MTALIQVEGKRGNKPYLSPTPLFLLQTRFGNHITA